MDVKTCLQKLKYIIVPVIVAGVVLFFLVRKNRTEKAEYRPLEQVTVAVATDLHYLSPSLTDHGKYFQDLIKNGDGKAMEYCEEITDAFVEQMIKQKPDALVLSGDITFNGEKESHIMLAEKLKRIKEKGIPVFVMPGNHDLENPMAASFHGRDYTLADSVSGKEFQEIYRDFGFGDAVARDESSLSYVAEPVSGFRILMIDVNTAESPGRLTDRTLRWTEKQLKDASEKGIHILAVSHQNLLQHNSLFSSGYIMENNDSLLKLFEKYGVICNLSGHMHVQHITRSAGGLTEIATSSLMVSPNRYGVLTLAGNSADYRTVPVDVPDVRDYSHDFLWETAYRQAKRESVSQTDIEELSRFFADINTAYVSGRMDKAEWDEELFQKWKEQDIFLPVYMQSIYDDGFRDHTKYSFQFHKQQYG